MLLFNVLEIEDEQFRSNTILARDKPTQCITKPYQQYPSSMDRNFTKCKPNICNVAKILLIAVGLTYTIETFELCDNKFYYTEWIILKKRRKKFVEENVSKLYQRGKGGGIFIEIFFAWHRIQCCHY